MAEEAAAHGLRDLPLARLAAGRARELTGQGGDFVRVGRVGVDEERHVAPARVDGVEAREALAAGVGQLDGVDARQLVGAQAEDVEVELGDAEAPVAPAQQARVRRVEVFAEGAVGELGPGRVAQVGGAARKRAGEEAAGARRGVEPVARAGEAAEAFDEHHVPARHGAHEVVEEVGRPAPPAEADGAGHVDAAAAPVERRDEARADEVAEVGDGPVVAGLDVLVFPEAVDGAAALGGLGRDQLDEAAQHAGARRQPVLVAVDLRHELPQLLRVVALVAVEHCAFVTHKV